jgi:integrase
VNETARVNEVAGPADSGLIVMRPGDAPLPAYADVDYAISEEAASRLAAAVPDNTRIAYENAWGQFARWCAGNGRAAMPATPQTLTEYASTLIMLEFAPATVDQAVGVIRARHRDAGYKDQPDTQGAVRVLRAYRRDWAGAGNRARQALPLLLPTLRAMAGTCDPGTLIGVRDRAMLLTGFNIMGRRSEVCGLDIRDIRAAGEDGIKVCIRQSKTGQDADGEDVPVPYGQHAETCAVRAVRAWTAVLAERGITSGPLFRPVDRHGHIGGGPVAAGKPATRHTPQNFNNMVKARARTARLPDGSRLPGAERYTAHSLRSGAATSAYAAGVPVWVIARHGRWSEKSRVVLTYIRAVDAWRDNPMKGLGL